MHQLHAGTLSPINPNIEVNLSHPSRSHGYVKDAMNSLSWSHSLVAWQSGCYFYPHLRSWSASHIVHQIEAVQPSLSDPS